MAQAENIQIELQNPNKFWEILGIILFSLLILAALGGFIYWILYKQGRVGHHPPAPAPGSNSNSGPNSHSHCIIPTGTWTNTCVDGNMDGSVLTALCQNGNETCNTEGLDPGSGSSSCFITTSIDLSRCQAGSLTNNSGVLTCTTGSDFCSDQSCAIHPGDDSFTSNCVDYHIDGTTLVADCSKDLGVDPVAVSLNLEDCRQGKIFYVGDSLFCLPGKGYC